MRLVLDKEVIVSAMQSPAGASATLILSALEGKVCLVANVPLIIEYEATCSRSEHRLAAGLTAMEVIAFLDGLAALIEPLESHFLWRPRLRDPADEMVLEAAVNGQADMIVTFNGRDFRLSPQSFGIEVLRPADVLRRLML